MTTIGNFTKSSDGYAGTVRTLTVNVKVKLVPTTKDTDNAPDFRIYAGPYELGAAWKKTSKANRDYLSVSIDDPSLPRPIYARLVDTEDGSASLIWSRSNGD